MFWTKLKNIIGNPSCLFPLTSKIEFSNYRKSANIYELRTDGITSRICGVLYFGIFFSFFKSYCRYIALSFDIL